MFTYLYYLRVVIYCSCYFFSLGWAWGGARNFNVSLTGRPQQTTRIDFHNTQHEGTPFCGLLWHSLNSWWWYIWSGFLCFSVLLKLTLKLGCMWSFVLPLLAGIFFAFSMKIQIIMQSNLLIKMYGLVTKEWNRPHASLTALLDVMISHVSSLWPWDGARAVKQLWQRSKRLWF